MTGRRDPRANLRGYERAHYLIDGRGFTSLDKVYREARARGWHGSDVALLNRIRAGSTTWAELLAPLENQNARGHRAGKRDEIAEAIAAVDERKRQIAAAQAQADAAEEE